MLFLSAHDAEWNSFYERLPVKDVHFSSGYARVQEELGGNAVLAVYRVLGFFIMQPFLVMPIPGALWSDVRSFYGFGGPVANFQNIIVRSSMAQAFADGIAKWARTEEIVSEYCCLHPYFLDQQEAFLRGADAERIKEVAVIDLTVLPSNDPTEGMSRRVRRGVKNAGRAGASVEQVEPNEDNRALFAKLYSSSISRLRASERWNFSKGYLDAHFKQLPSMLFFARDVDGVVRRALLVLRDRESTTAYAHFLGSDGEAYGTGLDELLYLQAAVSLRDLGYKSFHLGGGTSSSPIDPLLAFKSGFTKERKSVVTYKRIFDEARYQQLVGIQRSEEVATMGRESAVRYFPEYRREFA